MAPLNPRWPTSLARLLSSCVGSGQLLDFFEIPFISALIKREDGLSAFTLAFPTVYSIQMGTFLCSEPSMAPISLSKSLRTHHGQRGPAECGPFAFSDLTPRPFPSYCSSHTGSISQTLLKPGAAPEAVAFSVRSTRNALSRNFHDSLPPTSSVLLQYHLFQEAFPGHPI